jgi:hypothetical protein
VSVIVAALSLGAGAFAKGWLSEAGKDAYKALKEAVLRLVSPSDVEKLEQHPDSESRKGVIIEELEQAGKAEDPELARLAQALVITLKEAGAVGGATGVSLEEVEAVNVRLQNIIASGTGVSIEKSKFTGDIEASGISAGVPLPGKLERR